MDKSSIEERDAWPDSGREANSPLCTTAQTFAANEKTIPGFNFIATPV
jgi:hypothetical protein